VVPDAVDVVPDAVVEEVVLGRVGAGVVRTGGTVDLSEGMT